MAFTITTAQTYRLNNLQRGSAVLWAVVLFSLAGVALRKSIGLPRAEVLVGCALLVTLGALAIIWMYVARLTLFPDHIEIRGLLGTSSLMFNDIKGRRRKVGQYSSWIALCNISEEIKPLELKPFYGRDTVFDDWLNHLPDLDALDEEKAVDRVSSDPSYGATPAERRDKVEALRRNSYVLAAVPIVACLWTAYSYPFKWLTLASILLPWVAIGLVMISRGLYTIVESDPIALKTKGNISILMLLAFLPVMQIARQPVTEITSFPINWYQLIMPSLLIGMFMALLAFKCEPNVKFSVPVFLVIAIPSSFYASGATSIINSTFDHRAFLTYVATITSKQYISGKRGTYLLNIHYEQSSDALRAKSLDVNKQFYQQFDIGQTVCVELHAGFLGMPWQHVSRCS